MDAARASKVQTYAFGLAAMLLPAAMQFALFAFLARTLGAEQYGFYLALLSWSPICFELVGWGAGEYLIKQSARDKNAYPHALRHLRAVFWISLPLAVLFFTSLTALTTGATIDLPTIALVGFAEFAGMRLMVNAEQASIAQGRFGSANWVRCAQVLPRAMGIMFTVFALQQQTFDAFAVGGSLGTLAGGLVISIVLSRQGRGPWRLSLEGLRQGTWFTGTQLVRAAQHNVDRIVLSAVADPLLLGLYGAAQRFIQIGLLPAQAVLRIAYPGFFKAGANGPSAAARYAWSVLPLTLAAAAAASVGLAATAKLLPLLIGPEFEPSASYLLYLAPTLPLFAINSVLSDTLSGAGYLPLRLALTAGGVLLQATMFSFLHNGTEIVLASYAGIGLSSGLTALAVVLLVRGERRTALAAA